MPKIKMEKSSANGWAQRPAPTPCLRSFCRGQPLCRPEIQKTNGQVSLSVLLFFLDIFHDVLYPAIQNPAEHLNGVGADTFVALEPGDLAGTDPVFLDERVLGHLFFPHSFP